MEKSVQKNRATSVLFLKKLAKVKKNRSIGQSGHPVRDRNFDIANEQAKQERKK
jgi:hypothetical protein